MKTKDGLLTASQCYLLLFHACEAVFLKMIEFGASYLSMVPVVMAATAVGAVIVLEMFRPKGIEVTLAPDEPEERE